jgi:CubicO group peptidase (beta-lactamase class C family)
MRHLGVFRYLAGLGIITTTALVLGSGSAAATLKPAPGTPTGVAMSAAGDNSRSAPALTAADLEPWLDGHLMETLATNKVAGAAVVVVKDGRVLLKKGYGYADVATKKPVDPDVTTFRPASISKLFTWTAIMQLVEEGKMSLDEDINAYLDFKIAGMNDSVITIRHVMTHTAGFEETLKIQNFDDPAKITPLVKFIRQDIPRRIYPPGSTPAYSNYGAALAGYIVQRVSGMSFDDYMDKRLLNPLGMSSSSFRQPPPPALLAAGSRGYIESDQPPIGPEYFNDAAAGSLTATPADMAKFMIEHLKNERPGGVLLKPATAKAMHRTITRKFPGLNGMALGFYEANRNGHRVIAHGGDITAFHSDLHLFLDDNVGVFISMNSASNVTTDVRGRLMTAFSDRYFPDASATEKAMPVATNIAKKHAQEVAGEYYQSRGSKNTFIKIGRIVQAYKLAPNDDGTITGSAGPFLSRFIEIKPYLWEESGTDNRLQVTTQKDGSRIMAFNDISPIIIYTRTATTQSSAFLKPTVGLSLIILLLTVVCWPISALLRRRYRAAADWKPQEKLPVLARRIGSIALLMPVIGWLLFVIMPLLQGAPPRDGLLTAVQISTMIGAIIAVAAIVLSAIGGIRKCRSALRWGTSLAWTLAATFVIYQLYAFNFLDINTTY